MIFYSLLYVYQRVCHREKIGVPHIFPLIQVSLSSGAVHRALAEQLLSVDDFLSFKAMRRDGTGRHGNRGSEPAAGGWEKHKHIGKMWMKQRNRMFHDFSVDEGLEETEFKGKSEVHSVFICMTYMC